MPTWQISPSLPQAAITACSGHDHVPQAGRGPLSCKWAVRTPPMRSPGTPTFRASSRIYHPRGHSDTFCSNLLPGCLISYLVCQDGCGLLVPLAPFLELGGGWIGLDPPTPILLWKELEGEAGVSLGGVGRRGQLSAPEAWPSKALLRFRKGSALSLARPFPGQRPQPLPGP